MELFGRSSLFSARWGNLDMLIATLFVQARQSFPSKVQSPSVTISILVNPSALLSKNPREQIAWVLVIFSFSTNADS